MCSSRIQVEALSVPPRKNGPRGRVWNSLWGKNPSGLRRSAAPCRLTLPHTTLGKVSRKKVAVLLDFVQMRGGGHCPNFLSTFHKLYILGQFGDGEGGGDPCPNFLAHWRSKKVVQVVQIRGRGVRGNLDKIQKKSYFFSGDLP